MRTCIALLSLSLRLAAQTPVEDKMKIRLTEDGFKYFGPVIDVHTHIFPGNEWRLLEAMQYYNIVHTNLISHAMRGTKPFDGTAALLQWLHPERFSLFVHFDPRGTGQPGYGEKEAARLAGHFANGAVGLKLHWSANHRPYPINDPRLDPIFQAAEKANAIVMVHMGYSHEDPVEIERHFALKLPWRAEWGPERKPPFTRDEYRSMVRAFNRRENQDFEDVLKRYPRIRFIGAHYLHLHFDLAELDRMLGTYPNLSLDSSAGLPYYLNEHPELFFQAREFVLKRADSLMFSIDLKPGRGHYINRFEGGRKFFEGKGKWLYFSRNGEEMRRPCLDLPLEAVEKILYGNAGRWMGTRRRAVNIRHFLPELLEEYEFLKKAGHREAVAFVEAHLDRARAAGVE